MKEFTYGLKFQFYYWYEDQAVCLNFAGFTKPTDFNLIMASKLEQCSRVLIKCFDSWDDWKSVDKKILGTCTLSSSEDVTMYQFKPFENELTHFWLGNDTYMENFCWPGPTPIYSNFMKYPDNFMWAVINTYLQFDEGWKTAYRGLPAFNPAFDGPVQRRPWSEIYQDTKAQF